MLRLGFEVIWGERDGIDQDDHVWCSVRGNAPMRALRNVLADIDY